MKRYAISTLLAVVAIIFSSLPSQVYAASIQDTLTEALAQSQSVTQIQDLLRAKEVLDKSNKSELVNTVVQTALQQMAGGAGIDNLPVTNDSTTKIKTELRNQVQQAVTKEMAPYQDGLNAIVTLLGQSQKLLPEAADNNNSLTGAPENYRKVLNMTATAYGPGPLDNGKWNDRTYMGGTVQKGVAAVDPSLIPMGTKLWIEGYGAATAVDQGSAIKGNRIDLAFNNRQDALDYGIQYVIVYVLN